MQLKSITPNERHVLFMKNKSMLFKSIFYLHYFSELYYYIRLKEAVMFVYVCLSKGFSMGTYSRHVHLALLLVLHFLTVSLATQDDLLINTRQGKVQGKTLQVPGGEIRAFLGIPYGKPPVGQLRFRAPEPAEKWERVKDATTYPNSCQQMPDVAFPGRTRV